ncbi:DUF87 domain-containing protein [Anatilimnocola sp. NA78]|uniref:helicase HerA domain-containing protein n=1 Tax=Anatilimnocola sp. NA78 TaxID=3415683 RepID=UPI003CE4BD6E
MTEITIGKSDAGDVTIDVARLIVSRLLVTSSSGGGKSWLLRKILEEVSATTQTIVIDPEGEFASLRELRDMVLVGPDGDLPADPRSAGLLARRLMEKNVSAVIDIYELPPTKRREFVANFCQTLVDLPKALWRPCFVAIDETHEFAPEGDNFASSEAVALLSSKGRKRGFCPLFATQRLSKLSKDVAAEAKVRFVGQTNLDVDQRRAADFLGFPKNRWTELRDLSQPGSEGEFFAVGPALNDRGVIRFRSGKVATTHPKAGEGRKLEPPKPSRHIAALLGELKDLPQQAEKEANDLAAAKKRIADLECELKLKPAPTLDVAFVQRAVDTALNTERSKVSAERSTERSMVKLAIAELKKARDLYADVQSILAKVIGDLIGDQIERPSFPALSLSTSITNSVKSIQAPPPKVVNQPRKEAVGDLAINKTQQRILDALAWYESIGIYEPTNIQLGAIALIDTSGGHFSNVIGPLSTNSLVTRGDGKVALTTLGRSYASTLTSITTLDEYHDMLRARVRKAKSAGGKTIEILDAVIAAGSCELTTEYIGEVVGIDPTGGHFSNMIGPLGTLGLIERNRGIVKPTNLLFPKNVF